MGGTASAVKSKEDSKDNIGTNKGVNELSTIDCNELIAPYHENPDFMSSIFTSAIEVHAPLKGKNVTSYHAPWITAEIKNLMKEHDLAKRDKIIMLLIDHTIRNCGTTSLLNFEPGCRKIAITLLTKLKSVENSKYGFL